MDVHAWGGEGGAQVNQLEGREGEVLPFPKGKRDDVASRNGAGTCARRSPAQRIRFVRIQGAEPGFSQSVSGLHKSTLAYERHL